MRFVANYCGILVYKTRYDKKFGFLCLPLTSPGMSTIVRFCSVGPVRDMHSVALLRNRVSFLSPKITSLACERKCISLSNEKYYCILKVAYLVENPFKGCPMQIVAITEIHGLPIAHPPQMLLGVI
jgi:hypothetical protein